MSVTATTTPTLAGTLNNASPTDTPSVLQQMQLGTMLTPQVFDTGTIGASATVTLPLAALLVASARVVTSGTAGSVGSYLVSDAGATLSTPTSASTQAGVAKISADGKTLTFPNTITRAVVTYMPRSAVDLTGAYHTGY